jgi:protein-serine/threonine kinase
MKTIYKSSISVIKRDDTMCCKSYKFDNKDKKITKEFCVCSCLKSIGLDVMDINIDVKRHSLVMPYMKNGDVLRGVNNYTEEQLDYIFKKVVLIVDKLHDNGVSHRDIKPENIMIDDNFKVILTDFGECEVFRLPWETLAHKVKGICGTTQYIAPEEYIQNDFDPVKIDIWALGVFYYTMFFRKFPWGIANKTDFKYNLFLSNKNNFLCGLPAIFKYILEDNPEKRMTTKDIINDKWFRSIEQVSLQC